MSRGRMMRAPCLVAKWAPTKAPVIEPSAMHSPSSHSTLPPSANQLGALKEALAKAGPAVAGAKAQSEALANQARSLRQKLIEWIDMTPVAADAKERPR